MVGGAVFLVVFLTTNQIGGEMPMIYFEKLDLPMLSILLPVAGIVAFLLALPGILERRSVGEASDVIEFSSKSSGEEPRRAELFQNHLPEHRKAA